MAPEPGITAREIVKRIIDGDTLDVELRLPVRIRLLDCWAPEMSDGDGLAAKFQLERMAPEGSPVIIQIPTADAHSVKDVFTFGRVLATAWREGDEFSLNDNMIDSGHASRTRN